MSMSTRVTRLLNIKHPLVLPGMSWISTPQLVAATRESIREIRRLTDKPFGVGATLLMPGAEENARVALEEQVPVINFSLGKGDWIVEAAHKYGGKVIATVVSEKHARSAELMGADCLMVTGHEAAAHGGDVTSLVLVPCIASKVSIPIICAGGVANGKGLLAMLSLGADGVAMGSRFATTMESPRNERTKAQIVLNSEDDTIYGKNFDGLYARIMKTKAGEEAMRRPVNPVVAAWRSMAAAKMIGMPLWKVVPGLLLQWDKMYLLSLFGAATQKLVAATVDGDLENGVQFVGQSQGLIGDVPSVEELVDRCIGEALQTHADLNGVFVREEGGEEREGVRVREMVGA
ncbi:hypothetical protein B484DRAFT_406615 [Ochromonadaceae sp. CCMP2298]|nr:hypothetical protein B484DRAFT_406615 [Ochromonadaceae sp. CCMP2298]